MSLLALWWGVAVSWILQHSDTRGASFPSNSAAIYVGGVVMLTCLCGLYTRTSILNLQATLWRIAAITAPVFGLAVLTTGELAHHTNVPIYPYRWEWTLGLTCTWLICAISLRMLMQNIHQSGRFSRRVVFLGSPNLGRQISDLAFSGNTSIRLVGQLDPAELATDRSRSLTAFAAKVKATEIVIAVDPDDINVWDRLFECRVAGIRITSYADFYEREAKRIALADSSTSWFVLSGNFKFSKFGSHARQVADVLLAVIGLVAAAPVMVITALAIKLQDGGPIFYRQERIGLGGRRFMLLKFRSMKLDAEVNGIPAWAGEHDCRITSVGRIIRKVRIDEIPQFVNVLLGDMSVIGPRPERPFFVQQLSESIPWYNARHSVKPGITGWAQVSFRYGASLQDAERKLSYDLYYIRHRSFRLDLAIVVRTVGVVIRGDGAR